MTTAMTERTRVIFDTDDVVKRAIRLRAAKGAADQSVSGVINEILREALADEIAELERIDQQQGDKKARRGK